MPTATIDGTELAYEVIGDHGEPWVLTPGAGSARTPRECESWRKPLPERAAGC